MANVQTALLSYDYSGALLKKHGISVDQIEKLTPDLIKARHEILEIDIPLYESNSEIPKEKQPLDTAFIRMPEKLLDEYRSKRDESELGQILKCGQRIRESCDRVVVLGIGGSYMGAKALMDTCCHPYHNELSRAQRGGRPRMYFEGNNVDNDSITGLLELIAEDEGPEDWAIVVISKSGGTLETAVTFRIFLDALRDHCNDDAAKLAKLVVPVTGSSGKLHSLATALGCPDIFQVPEGVGGRFSVLSPVGLLPAAILGIDIVKLLEGAVAMTEDFASQPVGGNSVLDYTAAAFSMYKNGANLRVLSVWAKCLETLGLWYDQLLAESLGKNEVGATPFTVVNTRDLHSRAQQHQEGARDKFITNVIVNDWKRDPLIAPESDLDQDELNAIAGKTIPQIMSAAIAGTNQAYLEDRRPTSDLFLPTISEETIGQLMQMLMLATVVEGRVMGINPYGQPGVEKYKHHMKSNLDQ